MRDYAYYNNLVVTVTAPCHKQSNIDTEIPVNLNVHFMPFHLRKLATFLALK